jgi:hypothetical protein
MRLVSAIILVVACSAASTAPAQILGGGADERPKWTCPPSGYFPPVYGVVGRNGGDGLAPTEVISPCTPDTVRKAADAIGMARSHGNSPLGLKSVVTTIFTAEGTYAANGKAPTKVDHLDFHIHYGLPGARLMVTTGGKTAIRAMNDDYGWTEVTEGGAATPAQSQARDLYALTKLTPYGAMWSVIEAEGHTQVSTVGGKTVLRGTSPYDDLDVTETLDAQNRPESVKVVDGNTTYGATFSDYRSDLEPDYLFRFPKHLVWTKDGQPLADLTVSYYRTNPYVAFPVPANIKQAANR